MKKNLRIVLGLVFLFQAIASCEPEDEINALKTNDSPIIISEKDQVDPAAGTYDIERVEEDSCDEIESTTLYAGQEMDVGWVHISNSEDYLFVSYDLNHTSWSLQETHLYVGSEQGIPRTQARNPKIGHFQYHSEQDESHRKEYLYAIPSADLDECLVIVAHALVENDEDARHTETAFGYGHGNAFSGSRWGWFIDYCLQECEDMEENGDDESDDTEAFDEGPYTPFPDWGTDCLVGYAFNSTDPTDSHCFLSDGFEQWGWSNQMLYDPRMNYVSGYVQNFPLLASAFQCDISNSLEVGDVEVRLTGGDGRYQAEVRITITDTTYDLEDFNLYVGTERYPLDDNQNSTIRVEYFDYGATSLGTREYSTGQIPWHANSNFIARAVLCPTRS